MADLTEKQAKRQGASISFGIAQLNNPTPTLAKNIFRAFLAASAFWALAAPAFTEIDAMTLASINKYLLVGNVAINQLIRFFGWDFSTKG